MSEYLVLRTDVGVHRNVLVSSLQFDGDMFTKFENFVGFVVFSVSGFSMAEKISNLVVNPEFPYQLDSVFGDYRNTMLDRLLIILAMSVQYPTGKWAVEYGEEK